MKPKITIQSNPASIACQNSRTEQRSLPRSSTTFKSRAHRALLTIGVALCGSYASLAQSLPPEWVTVDDVENGWAHKIAADRLGNVFLTGTVSVAGVNHPCISKSSDQGVSWSSTVYTDIGVSSFSGIAAATIEVAPATDASPAVLQDLLVTSSYTTSGQWITRRSLNAGATWETVDIVDFLGISSAWSPQNYSVAIDTSGNIYVVGMGVKATTTVVKNKTSISNAYYWLIRKISRDATVASPMGKTTFELSETISPGYVNRASAVTCVGIRVFVAGQSGNRWQVRKYSGDGGTWELVDDFRYDPNYPSHPNRITKDSLGNVYVVGEGMRAVGPARPVQATAAYWIVRKGNGIGTSSFLPVDRFELELNKGAVARGVTVDLEGNLHVIGTAASTVAGYTRNRWFTRTLKAGATEWLNADHYFLSPSEASIGHNIVADSAGNVFAAGRADEPTVLHNWVVRRQLAPVP